VVPDIEGFGAELERLLFVDLDVFEQREVPAVAARADDAGALRVSRTELIGRHIGEGGDVVPLCDAVRRAAVGIADLVRTREVRSGGGCEDTDATGIGEGVTDCGEPLARLQLYDAGELPATERASDQALLIGEEG
jgi:hypothetical protein